MRAITTHLRSALTEPPIPMPLDSGPRVGARGRPRVGARGRLRIGVRGRLPYWGTGHAFARMTARQLWRPPVGIPTRVIQVPWGRRLCEIELACIKLGESAISWAEKFFEKTCPSRPSRPRQSWTERGPALRSGALSRNQSCPLSAPCAPVEAVSSTSCIPLSSLRAMNCCAIIVRAGVRVKGRRAY